MEVIITAQTLLGLFSLIIILFFIFLGTKTADGDRRSVALPGLMSLAILVATLAASSFSYLPLAGKCLNMGDLREQTEYTVLGVAEIKDNEFSKYFALATQTGKADPRAYMFNEMPPDQFIKIRKSGEYFLIDADQLNSTYTPPVARVPNAD